MNQVYRDQLAKAISAAFTYQDGWKDVEAAKNALEWLIGYLQGHLSKCLQAEDTGVCDMTWKHDDCAVLMAILYDLTRNEKYKDPYGSD